MDADPARADRIASIMMHIKRLLDAYSEDRTQAQRAALLAAIEAALRPAMHHNQFATDRLAELRRLSDAATPGPWLVRPDPYDDWGYIRGGLPDEFGRREVVARGRSWDDEAEERQARHERRMPRRCGANTGLIAAAVNYVRDVLASPEALRPAGAGAVAGDGWQPIKTAPEAVDTFQARVQPWLLACFGPEIAGNRIERNHRFIEEALELIQANGTTRSEAHQLVDYVFDRPAGDLNQEVGGVMVTLAALCLASGLDMHEAGETELARVWTKVETIRAKQAAKPKHSPPPADPHPGETERGIYIASKSTHGPRWREMRDGGVPIISTWIDESGVGETGDFSDLWTRCITEAVKAKATIVYREPNEVLKGALVAVGAALAVGRKVFTVGPIEGSWTKHPSVVPCLNLYHALNSAFAALDAAPDGGA